jgi:hypothetical protein
MSRQTHFYHRCKMLCVQDTNLALWYTTDVSSDITVPPVAHLGLDLKIYRGYVNFNLYNEINNFRVYCLGPDKIKLKDDFAFYTEQKRQQIYTIKAKAYALAYLINSFEFCYETAKSFDDREVFNRYLTIQKNNDWDNRWVHGFAQAHKITHPQAVKLINFKLEEEDSILYKIEMAKFQMIREINECNTVEEVTRVYERTAVTFIYPTRPNLKDLIGQI